MTQMTREELDLYIVNAEISLNEAIKYADGIEEKRLRKDLELLLKRRENLRRQRSA